MCAKKKEVCVCVLQVCEYPDGTKSLKLGDFGLATVVEGPLHTVCGTPTYVAPEIIAETGWVRTSADVLTWTQPHLQWSGLSLSKWKKKTPKQSRSLDTHSCFDGFTEISNSIIQSFFQAIKTFLPFLSRYDKFHTHHQNVFIISFLNLNLYVVWLHFYIIIILLSPFTRTHIYFSCLFMHRNTVNLKKEKNNPYFC